MSFSLAEILRQIQHMWSRDQGRAAALTEKSRRLWGATRSRVANKASVIADALECIRDLKKRVESFELAIDPNLVMEVNVETLDRGFRINVYSERSCPGLLVSILEAFEEVGLHVQDARVSCSDSFSLEAIGEEDEEDDSIDSQVVKQAVLQAVRTWSEAQKG